MVGPTLHIPAPVWHNNGGADETVLKALLDGLGMRDSLRLEEPQGVCL
jgi:hypothetical protein